MLGGPFLCRLRYTAAMNLLWLLLWSCVKPVAVPPTHAPSAMALPALRGPVRPLPSTEDTLRRITFGSCANQRSPMPILRALAVRQPDLFVMLGDNVYGDADAGDATLPELRAAYAALAQHPDFRPLAAAVPVLPVWDDHDYADNDGGGSFPFKQEAELLFGVLLEYRSTRPARYAFRCVRRVVFW